MRSGRNYKTEMEKIMKNYITDICFLAGKVSVMRKATVDGKENLYLLLKTTGDEHGYSLIPCVVPADLCRAMHFREGSWIFVVGMLKDTRDSTCGGRGFWIDVNHIVHLKEKRLQGYYNQASFTCWFPEETNYQVCLSAENFLWQRLQVCTVHPQEKCCIERNCLLPRDVPADDPDEEDLVQMTGALIMDCPWAPGAYLLVGRIDKPEDIAKAVPFLNRYESI